MNQENERRERRNGKEEGNWVKQNTLIFHQKIRNKKERRKKKKRNETNNVKPNQKLKMHHHTTFILIWLAGWCYCFQQVTFFLSFHFILFSFFPKLSSDSFIFHTSLRLSSTLDQRSLFRIKQRYLTSSSSSSFQNETQTTDDTKENKTSFITSSWGRSWDVKWECDTRMKKKREGGGSTIII